MKVYVVTDILYPNVLIYQCVKETDKSLIVKDHGAEKILRKSSLAGWSYDPREATRQCRMLTEKKMFRLQQDIKDLKKHANRAREIPAERPPKLSIHQLT